MDKTKVAVVRDGLINALADLEVERSKREKAEKDLDTQRASFAFELQTAYQQLDEARQKLVSMEAEFTAQWRVFWIVVRALEDAQHAAKFPIPSSVPASKDG